MTSFEVLTAVFVRIRAFREVTPCRCVVGSGISKDHVAFNLKAQAVEEELEALLQQQTA